MRVGGLLHADGRRAHGLEVVRLCCPEVEVGGDLCHVVGVTRLSDALEHVIMDADPRPRRSQHR